VNHQPEGENTMRFIIAPIVGGLLWAFLFCDWYAGIIGAVLGLAAAAGHQDGPKRSSGNLSPFGE